VLLLLVAAQLLWSARSNHGRPRPVDPGD